MNHPIPAPRRPVDTRPIRATTTATVTAAVTGAGTTYPAGATRPASRVQPTTRHFGTTAQSTGTVFTSHPRRPVSAAGLVCVSCTHRTCRAQRARTLPRLGGHRSEFAREHHQAAVLQSRHKGVLVWWGEATQSFWVASATGMYGAKSYDDLLAYLWAYFQG